VNKAPDAFRTIGEVADELDLPQHVLRFWESQFPHIKPVKRAGGRRYYRPEDIDLLRGIRRLLYGDGYTIKGVQRILREQGLRAVQSVGQGLGEAKSGPGADGDDTDEAAAEHQVDDDADDDDLDAAAVTTEVGAKQAGARPHRLVAMRRPARPSATEVSLATMSRAARTAPAASATDPAGGPSAGKDPAAANPAAAATVSAGALAGRDLDRLKQALTGLEACRRLLEKAVEKP